MNCGAAESRCVCSLPSEHEGPHVCDCAGSWEWGPDGFKVHAWPSIPQDDCPGWRLAAYASLKLKEEP